jgi:hypothetical protein
MEIDHSTIGVIVGVAISVPGIAALVADIAILLPDALQVQ